MVATARARNAWKGRPKAAWWTLDDEEEIARNAIGVAQRIDRDQAGRRNELRECRRLFEQKLSLALVRGTPRTSSRLNYNVCRANVQTACAKIGKNRPRLQIATTEGSYDEQEQAELLTTWLDGMFKLSGAHEVAFAAFRDSCWADIGIVHPFVEDEQIRVERVPPDELLVDARAAYYGEPREMYRRRRMSREVLAALYPEHAEAISRLAPATFEGVEIAGRASKPDPESNLVDVYEAWHLPTTKDAKDGVHLLAIEGAALSVEEYAFDYFPFLPLYWETPLDGFYGQGIVESLAPLQWEITELLQRIRIAQKTVAPKYILPPGVSIDKDAWDNDPRGAFVQMKGAAMGGTIQVLQPSAVSPELYQQLEVYYRKSFELQGMSEMAAMGRKPPGVDAAVAMRELSDVQTDRFAPIAQRYEDLFVRLGEVFIDLARVLYAANPKTKLAVKGDAGEFIRKIGWKDVDMRDDAFKVRTFPTSQLPATLTGKIQTLTEMMKIVGDDGKPMVSGDVFMQALNVPDLKGITNVRTAPLELARRVASLLLRKGKAVVPEEHWPLEVCMTVVQLEMLKAQNDGVSEERIDLARTFLQQIIDMKNDAAASAAPPPTAGPPMPPGAMPGAPPMPMPPPGPPVG